MILKHRDIACLSRYFNQPFPIETLCLQVHKCLKRSLSSLFHFPRWSCELPNLQTLQLCSFFLAEDRARKNVCRPDL